jgi:hypothetical protein
MRGSADEESGEERSSAAVQIGADSAGEDPLGAGEPFSRQPIPSQ